MPGKAATLCAVGADGSLTDCDKWAVKLGSAGDLRVARIDPPLSTGNKYALTLEFQGKMNTWPFGIYVSKERKG